MSSKKVVNDSWETSQVKSYRLFAVYEDMLDSPAWAELSGNAVKLYMALKRKHQRRVHKKTIISDNKNNISMPRAEYLKFIGMSTFQRSIDELIDLGFVKIIKNRYDTRECNIYGFSDMWRYWGTNSFKVEPEHRRTLAQQMKAHKDNFKGSYTWERIKLTKQMK